MSRRHLVKGSPVVKLIVDPENARCKKRWILALVDNVLEEAEIEGTLKVEAGQSKMKYVSILENEYSMLKVTVLC